MLLKATGWSSKRREFPKLNIQHQLWEDGMINKIGKFPQKWKEHVQRMQAYYPPRTAMEYRPQGQRGL